jgi:hypothetical protein
MLIQNAILKVCFFRKRMLELPPDPREAKGMKIKDNKMLIKIVYGNVFKLK